MSQAVEYIPYHPGYLQQRKQYKIETHRICPICGEAGGCYYDKYYEKDWKDWGEYVNYHMKPKNVYFKCRVCYKEDAEVRWNHERCKQFVLYHSSCVTHSVQVEAGHTFTTYSCCGGDQYHAGCQQRAVSIIYKKAEQPSKPSKSSPVKSKKPNDPSIVKQVMYSKDKKEALKEKRQIHRDEDILKQKQNEVDNENKNEDIDADENKNEYDDPNACVEKQFKSFLRKSKMGRYFDTFVANDCCNMQSIRYFDDEFLCQDIGIKNKIARK
eukprot:891492_1